MDANMHNVPTEEEDKNAEEVLRQMDRIGEEIDRRKKLVEEKKEKLKKLQELKVEDAILKEKIQMAMEEVEVSREQYRWCCIANVVTVNSLASDYFAMIVYRVVTAMEEDRGEEEGGGEEDSGGTTTTHTNISYIP